MINRIEKRLLGRIFLNIVATYGRSLYALVCGLGISWWVLAALGKTDLV